MMTEGLAFVNDWSILSKAVEALGTLDRTDGLDPPDSIAQLQEWVPKLIDSWSQLWDLSVALTTAVEAMQASQTPAGIYLPNSLSESQRVERELLYSPLPETSVKPPARL